MATGTARNPEQQDFATRQEQRVDEVRHETVRTSLRILLTGTPDRIDIASAALFTSVLYQAQLSGVRI